LFGSIAAGMPPKGVRRAPQQPAATFARRLAKPPKDAPLPSMLAGVGGVYNAYIMWDVIEIDVDRYKKKMPEFEFDKLAGSIVFYITCLILLFNNQQTTAS